jgi:hypothetical protein
MPGLGLLLRAVRRGLLGPAERAGLFPTRYYVSAALDALEDDDLEGAVAALEACGRRHDGDRRLALAREQTIFRIRTVAAVHRAAAGRAEGRAEYLAGLADEGLARIGRDEARRRRLRVGAVLLATAGGGAAAAALAAALPAAVAVAALAVAVIALVLAAAAARADPRLPPRPLAEAEAARLRAAAGAERRVAAAERAAAERAEALEARLARGRPPEGAPEGADGEAPPVVLGPGAYRRLG